MIKKILKLSDVLELSDAQLLGAFNYDALCQAYEQMQIWNIERIFSKEFSDEVKHEKDNIFRIKGEKRLIEVSTKRILASELLEKCKGNNFGNELAEDSLLDFIENDSELGEWKKVNDTYYYRRVDG